MSTKTAKVLHVIAFILILLTMAFVLVGWLAFKEQLIGLASIPSEYTQTEFVPWGLIIEVGFVLLLALIWLLVLLGKPGRGASIAVTIILSILMIGYFAVGKAYLNVWLTQKSAEQGPGSLAAISAFNSVASTLANFAFVPGLFLMVLSLGSACGKNFKPAKEEEPAETVQEPVRQTYGNRPNVQPAQQTYSQRPQYGQQSYGQNPAMQNTGYIPKVDAMQNTGYMPKVDAMQNTGYIPKVDAMQNTGYIPKADLAQNTAAVSADRPAQASAAVIYPWMKAAGAPQKKDGPDPEQKADEVPELESETLESEE